MCVCVFVDGYISRLRVLNDIVTVSSIASTNVTKLEMSIKYVKVNPESSFI